MITTAITRLLGAILDRLVHRSTRIHTEVKTMRKRVAAKESAMSMRASMVNPPTDASKVAKSLPIVTAESRKRYQRGHSGIPIAGRTPDVSFQST